MSGAVILKHLSNDRLKALCEKSDLRAWCGLGINYLLITAAFAAVIIWPNPLTFICAMIVLGGRILGLAILMHDCAHDAFFKSKKLNRWVGQWLCAAPVLADLDGYRTYHLKHHRTAGSEEDPDRSNYKGYPVNPRSLARKIFRDLTGLTGLKTLIIIYKMNAGLVAYQLSYSQSELQNTGPWFAPPLRALKNLSPTLVYHASLFSLFWFFGHPLAYLLWPASWLTTYMFFSRIRNAAEHAATPNIYDLEPINNTRTTYANWLERMTFAPNYVNYHLEHHILPAVPGYRLKTFHKELISTGALKDADIRVSYWSVICHLSRGTNAATGN
jgi:fatty acid desaturase